MKENPAPSTTSILTLAAFFGLLAGLFEGAEFLLFQKLEWLNSYVGVYNVTERILWFSPLFDLLLFLGVGLLLAVLLRWPIRLPAIQTAVFVFSFLAFFDLLGISGRIRLVGLTVFSLGLATVVTRLAHRNEARFAGWARGTLCWLALAALLLFAGLEGTALIRERAAVAHLPTAPPGSPNVLFIVIDTVRADHLSMDGYLRATSPNLDRIAARSVTFENAIAPSSWTLPSHASLLTGRYPTEHGTELKRFNERYKTLGEALEGHGYRTAAFSGNNFVFCRPKGFGKGFIHFGDIMDSWRDRASRAFYGRDFLRYVGNALNWKDLISRKGAPDVSQPFLQWLDADRTRPWFAFLNFFDPHEPYRPPQPYRSRFSRFKDPGGDINAFRMRHSPPSPEALEGDLDAYDGAIRYVDDQIGQLLAELDRRGLTGNTILILTSDHGESFGEHGLYSHMTSLYWELLRVPLMLSAPGRIPQGRKIARPVSNASLPATILELIGAPEAESFPVPSLVPLWADPRAEANWPYPRSEILKCFFWPLRNVPSRTGWLESVVTPEWHVILHEKNGPQLFDWAHDPGELHDLAATPEGKKLVEGFEGELRSRALHGVKNAS